VDRRAGAGVLARSWAKSRTSVRLLTLVGVCAVVAAGATGLDVMTAHRGNHAPATGPATDCAAPQAALAGTTPNHLGVWPYTLLEAGTFSSVTAGEGGALYAIQACGAEEAALRVVMINGGGKSIRASQLFEHDALLTSSLVEVGGELYFGAAKLDLTGDESAPPYNLTLYRLDAKTLLVTGTRALGRGYSISLYADPISPFDLLASTGSALLLLDRASLSPRVVTTLSKAVVQHVAVQAGSSNVALSVFSPAVAASAEDAFIEIVDLATDDFVSSYRLPDAADPESLTFAGGDLWASIGQGLSTQVERFSLPGLQLVDHGRPVTTGLQTISLGQSGSTVWMYGLTFVACALASTAEQATATVIKSSPASSVLGVTLAGRQAYVITQAGIGTVPIPAACTSR
jgi:hypothetical protein